MKRGIVIGLSATVCLGATLARADNLGEVRPPALIAKCQACHGPGGNSAKSSTPRLNGQRASYIEGQLKNFLDPGRQDPHATAAMWGVVRQVDNAKFAAIGAYYAAQTPTPAAANGGRMVEEGRKLFHEGEPTSNIPACGQCHGGNGEGADAGPRLAGQHREYLRNQLERMRLGLRASDVMHPNAINLSDGQIAALLAFLAND